MNEKDSCPGKARCSYREARRRIDNQVLKRRGLRLSGIKMDLETKSLPDSTIRLT